MMTSSAYIRGFEGTYFLTIGGLGDTRSSILTIIGIFIIDYRDITAISVIFSPTILPSLRTKKPPLMPTATLSHAVASVILSPTTIYVSLTLAERTYAEMSLLSESLGHYFADSGLPIFIILSGFSSSRSQSSARDGSHEASGRYRRAVTDELLFHFSLLSNLEEMRHYFLYNIALIFISFSMLELI